MANRKLVITENITLDGVIDMTGGWGDPDPEGDGGTELAEVNAEHSEAADALVVGRKTFEAFRSYWPEQSDDTTGVSDYLNRVHKYVVSQTIGDPEWQHSTVLRGDPIEEVRALKEEDGRDIVVTGSLTLVPALVAAGIVDEYRLFVYPVVVGTGARLFADAQLSLRLLESRPLASGPVLLRYAPAG